MNFKDPGNTASLICKHVLREQLPILFVSHDLDDGAWQFLCSVREHDENNVSLLALYRVVELDPTVDEVSDLPIGISPRDPQ